jgi:hypothetical protein
MITVNTREKKITEVNEIDKEIIDFLSGGDATPAMAIVQHCKCREATVRTRMRHLVNRGKIRRVAVSAKDLRISYYALVK